MNKKRPLFPAYLIILLVSFFSYSCQSQKILQLSDNSGWCWFQDDRAIIDGDMLIHSGVTSEGANIISSYDLNTGKILTVNLNKDSLPADDHNVGVVMIRPDGKYLATYAGHGVDQWMRFRISTQPGDISSWEPEQLVDVGSKVTYSNVYRMAENGITYNYHRGFNRNPNYMISQDDGRTWEYGGRLFAFEGRPYVRYASDHKKRIHFVTTEEHPRHYNNGIYHGYIEDNQVFRSDGSLAGPLSTSTQSNLSPQDFTHVYDGNKDTRADVAWTSDIQLDANGYPYIAFSVTKDPITLGETKNTQIGGFDHRYHYARWDGKQWKTYEIAYAGTRLYPGENEYTGLVTLHPTNPDVLYISTNVHPNTGKPIISKGQQRREIFRGTTINQGKDWKWKSITNKSTEDNIRPIVLDYNGEEVVIWLRGTYNTYKDYNMKVMGIAPAIGQK